LLGQEVFLGLGGRPTTWTASISYLTGSVIIPTTPNGYIYRSKQEITTGLIEPTWPTVVGNTVSDNGGLWECWDTALIS